MPAEPSAVTTTTEQSTAVVVIDDLMRHAKAALDTSETNLKRCFNQRLTAGYEFIKARQMCRDQGVSWSAKLKEHGIDRILAHVAIAEAGGDAAIDDEGRGRPGGIKPQSPDHRKAQARAHSAAYRAKQKELQRTLLLTSAKLSDATPDHDKTVAIRQSMLTKIAEHFAKQPDDYLSKFIKEHIQ